MSSSAPSADGADAANAPHPESVLSVLYDAVNDVVPLDVELTPRTDPGALGIGSVKLMRLTRTVNVAFDADLDVSDVAEADALGTLAEDVARHCGWSGDTASSDVDVVEGSSRPLTVNQKGLWIECNRNPDLYRYCTPMLFEVHDGVDLDVLAEAFEVVQERHPLLRTRLFEDDGEPRSVVVHDRVAMERTASDAPLDARIERLRKKSKRPFKLAKQEPLIEAEVVHGGDAPTLFYFNASHLIMDGRSCQLLLERLETAYDCMERGDAVPESLGESAFLDYPAWEEAFLESEPADRARDHWASHDGTLFGGLNLPSDEAPSASAFEAEHVRAEIPDDLFDRIEAQAREMRVTPYAILLAAFDLVLYRYTREADLTVGTVLLNRPTERFDDSLGYYANLVPVAAHLDDADSFASLVDRMYGTLLDLLPHQSLPFSEIARAVGETPGAGGAASVLPAYFSYQDWTVLDSEGSVFGAQYEDVVQASMGDLTFEVFKKTDGAVLLGKYDARTFREGTVELMLDSYLDVLDAVTEDPERATGEVLTPTEREQRTLDAWNDTDKVYPRVDNLYAFFDDQVNARPDAEAVVYGDERLTYRELEARVDAVAATLARHGVEKGTRVGLLLPRSTYLSTAVLAVLKLGAVYVPLDPEVPADRLDFIVGDAEPAVVATTASVDVDVPCERVDIDVDDVSGAVDTEAGETSWASYVADDPVYVIYTSGSTGKPKGVEVSHENLVSFHCTTVERYDIRPDDRVLAVTTMTFDIVFTEVVVPVLAGATSCVADADAQKNGRRLSGWIDRYDVTVLQGTPTMYKLLLASGWEGASSLKVAISIGEALGEEVAVQLRDRDVPIWNVYGPTENTIYSTDWRVDDPTDVHIGTPLDNVQVYVLDDDRRPVPVGAVGELYLGGKLVANGYRNRPELTAERFAPAPDGVADGTETLYQTGDLVRFSSEGNLYFLGRNDQQVKIRGHRVELQEIEHVLKKHEAVHDACVVVDETDSGVSRLRACLVARDGASVPTPKALREHLSAFLPEYMVPASYVRRDAMPLLPNGKVNRNAVLDGATSLTDEPTATRETTPAEDVVAAVWRDVLETDAVDVERNFFDAGGNSLLVLDLQRALANRFGVSVRTVDLFRYTSVEAQATWLADRVDDVPILSTNGAVSPSADDEVAPETSAPETSSDQRTDSETNAEASGPGESPPISDPTEERDPIAFEEAPPRRVLRRQLR